MTCPLSILVVTNIYPTRQHPTLGVFVEQQVNGLRAIGLKVEVFYVDRIRKGMGAYFRMFKPLSAAVQQTRPALLHVMYGGVMADQVMRWNCRIPKVVTFHGSDLLGENFSGQWRKWVSSYGVRCSRRAARKAQGVVVVSDELRKALPRGLGESRVRVIPCGIDLNRFKPTDKVTAQRQLGWHDQVFHVLFASSNGDPVKRPWLALAAVEVMKAAKVRAELHFMRRVPYDEVPLWMNASDALLMTSAQEGSPTVIKEALACGLPVVSVNVGDVCQRLEGIANCHVVLPNPEALAAKLISVQLSGCRINARAKLQQFSIDNIALQLERFYRETVALPN